MRWRPLAAQAEADNVSLLKGAWNAAWLDEVCLVPNGRDDDQADAAAAAFDELALRVRNTVRAVRLTGF